MVLRICVDCVCKPETHDSVCLHDLCEHVHLCRHPMCVFTLWHEYSQVIIVLWKHTMYQHHLVTTTHLYWFDLIWIKHVFRSHISQTCKNQLPVFYPEVTVVTVIQSINFAPALWLSAIVPVRFYFVWQDEFGLVKLWLHGINQDNELEMVKTGDSGVLNY